MLLFCATTEGPKCTNYSLATFIMRFIFIDDCWSSHNNNNSSKKKPSNICAWRINTIVNIVSYSSSFLLSLFSRFLCLLSDKIALDATLFNQLYKHFMNLIGFLMELHWESQAKITKNQLHDWRTTDASSNTGAGPFQFQHFWFSSHNFCLFVQCVHFVYRSISVIVISNLLKYFAMLKNSHYVILTMPNAFNNKMFISFDESDEELKRKLVWKWKTMGVCCISKQQPSLTLCST